MLDATGISVSFGGLRALDDVTVTVDDGAIVGLIGPNGAGKTTLFNVISGLQRPTSGAVCFQGRDISRLRPDQRARLGLRRSFQNLGLMADECVRTNVLAAQHLGAGYWCWDVLFRPWRWRAAERALSVTTTESLARLRLDQHLQDDVGDLSFGAARYVELAAVLSHRPTIALLDEPTTGLDMGEVDRLRSLLLDARDDGTTVLLIAHDVRFVMGLCDHVYVLAEGRILCDGSPAHVQRDPAVIDAYLGRTT